MPKVVTLAGFSWLLLALAPLRAGAAPCEPVVAKLVSSEGIVETRTGGDGVWRAATVGDVFCLSDQIRVRSHSRASIELDKDTVLRLDQHSTLILPDAPEQPLSFVELLRGALHLISRVRHRLEIRTPFVNAGLEGTEFVVRVLDAETRVSVLEGRVAVHNRHGRLSLAAGQSASAGRGAAPVLRLELSPADAVQWAIHYPLITDPDAPQLGPEIAEAQRLLSVGRVAEADALVERVRAAAPDSSDALALAAIAALARNDRPAAVRLARAAADRSPTSARALLALSFAQQAGFDLAAAQASVDRALEAEPANAIAWSRLAELRSARGDRRGGLAAAQRAVAFDPGLSRTQTVLGFSHLANFDTAAARAAFARAIELDSADPVARLGSGLAKMRDREPVAARRDMEIAVSLDPANALVRSYLGKAYLEEGRHREAAGEFALARKLDPRDPTPWLYAAQLYQATNRPALALRALQESIRLNGNRMVYRSKLLLDQDLATRTSSLAASFLDLGFVRLGALEAHESLAADPTNFSAHQLLADTYAALPRHEIASVSERHQALRLAPPSAMSLPPQSMFSDLGLPGSAGLRALAVNEFGRLYTRDGASLQLSGLIGGNATWADDLTVSGLLGGLGYSLGQFHYESDGYRPNNDLQHDIGSVFLNYALTPEAHVQFEHRDRRTEFGDLRLLFDTAAVDGNDRRDIDEQVSTLAGVQRFSPGEALIASLSYIDRSVVTRVDDTGSAFIGGAPVLIGLEDDRRTRTDGLDAELQYIDQGGHSRYVAGVRHLNLDRSTRGERLTYGFAFGPPPFFVPMQTVSPSVVREDDRVESTRVYLYSDHGLSEVLRLSLGLSVDRLDDPLRDEVAFNPKFGVTWHPLPATRLRAAATRNLSPPVAARRTLEPTAVAGFSQVFDDQSATLSDRLGVALDHRFQASLYGGVELSFRDLDIPVAASNQVVERDRDERQHQAYLYWQADDRWALRLAYAYEGIDNDRNSGADTPTGLSTHTLSAAVEYARPNGAYAGLSARRLRQDVDFPAVSSSTSGRDDFLILDARFGWRFPDRHGVIEVGVNNLLDEAFRYQDPYLADTSEPAKQLFQPERFVFVRGTVRF